MNFRRMWPYIKPYWFRALLGAILTIPVGALDGAVAMFLKPFMDKVMIDKQPHFSAMIPFLIVGFTIVQGILIYASNYLNTWVAQKITISVKRTLYAKLLSMDTSYFDRKNSGTIPLGQTSHAHWQDDYKTYCDSKFKISLRNIWFKCTKLDIGEIVKAKKIELEKRFVSTFFSSLYKKHLYKKYQCSPAKLKQKLNALSAAKRIYVYAEDVKR